MPKQISFKHQTGPALVSGGIFFQNFGEFERVTDFQLTHDLGGVLSSGIGALSGYSLNAYGVIVSGNQVRVNVEKRALANIIVTSGIITPVAPVVAVSGDVISNTFYTIAKGE